MTGNRRNVNDTPIARAPQARAPDGGGEPAEVLSVVIPVFNEHQTLEEFHRRLVAVLADIHYQIEILYVDDGSRDASLEILRSLRQKDSRITLIELSRNFGKEAAMTAGLDYAVGDAVIIIDADLQDPPEVIPDLITPWAEGRAEVVYAQRRSRAGETWLKRTSAAAFYRLMERVGRAPMPRNVGDFRLLSREVVRDLKRLREQHRFMKGLFAWVGYRQIAVPYDRDPRYAGESKWNYLKLWAFSIEGITSFTIAPLKVATYVGLVVAVLALIFGVIIIYETLAHGNPVPGYPSLMVVVLFLGGVQLTTIGILGEYVGRISDETKGRPLYLVRGREISETAEKRLAQEVPAERLAERKLARKAPESAPRDSGSKRQRGKASGAR